MEESKLDELVSKVISTFKFHGITIKNMRFKEGLPEFDIEISKSRKFRELKDELDFAYWTLWTLIYGEYSDKRTEQIILNYTEVE